MKSTIPKEYIGKTFKELGYYIISKKDYPLHNITYDGLAQHR
jgi:hypothetical protein